MPTALIRWSADILYIGLLAGALFHPFGDHPFAIHDRRYLQDSADISGDPYRFFAPDKRLPARPSVELFFWLDYELWGANEQYFHFSSVFFHVIASLLLAALVRHARLSWSIAPVERGPFLEQCRPFRAVYWIAALGSALSAIAAFLTVICLFFFTETRNIVWVVALYSAQKFCFYGACHRLGDNRTRTRRRRQRIRLATTSLKELSCPEKFL